VGHEPHDPARHHRRERGGAGHGELRGPAPTRCGRTSPSRSSRSPASRTSPGSRSSAARPGIDELIYMDLAGAYGVNVDQQVISGLRLVGSGARHRSRRRASTRRRRSPLRPRRRPSTRSSPASSTRSRRPGSWRRPDRDAPAPLELAADAGRHGGPAARRAERERPFNALASPASRSTRRRASPVGMFLGLPVITDASIPTPSAPARRTRSCSSTASRGPPALGGRRRHAPELRFEQTSATSSPSSSWRMATLLSQRVGTRPPSASSAATRHRRLRSHRPDLLIRLDRTAPVTVTGAVLRSLTLPSRA
jgi:hypothetical protein